MRRIRRLLLIVFIESFATICVERGIYFFTTARMDFAKAENLALAIAFGLAYFAAAFASHPVTDRLGARRVLKASILLVLAAHLALAVWMAIPAGRIDPLSAKIFVFATATFVGAMTGLKWPVIESYVSAGFTPSQTFQVVGKFSLAWAAAVPLAVALAGPMIQLHASALFVAPVLLNIVSLVLLRPLPAHPVHLPDDHPERPDPRSLRRMQLLLSAGRFQLLTSYCLMWILAAVVPNILESRFVLPVVLATAVAAVLELSRLKAFAALAWMGGFCDRVSVLAAVTLTMPAGFCLVLYAPNLALLIVGEIVFGLSAGVIYYASLYHALVIKNAAVSAGGAHEGLIGLGFALGPIAALGGLALLPFGEIPGMISGISCIAIPCLAAAGWKLACAQKLSQPTSIQ